ncbi:MAG: respiratory nitrate reductase subunit gamma, partial [Deltaproteobacteria bacterium]|nr:respiratory nitrate reductase subunit gamma [Deltaproteobacteria bacterium]
YDMVGIDGQAHSRIAYWSGLAAGAAAFAGSILLLWRRVTVKRIQVTTTINDYVTLTGLVFVTGAGLSNVVFSHYYLLDTIAPWIRGIVFFRPNPELMLEVPLSFKIHILSALALLGFSPFSRLVHIWSAPFTYLLRRYIVFRRRVSEAPSPYVE